MKKLQKRTARRAYNDGQTVYLVPSKVYPSFSSPWITPYGINKLEDQEQHVCELEFDKRVEEYQWYNTCFELGYYASYYIKD
jgi:hypothetical protein